MNFNDYVINEVSENLNNFKIKNCCIKNIVKAILLNAKKGDNYIIVTFKSVVVKDIFFRYIYTLFKKHKKDIVLKNEHKICYISVCKEIVELLDEDLYDSLSCDSCKKYLLLGYFIKNSVVYDPQKEYRCEITFLNEVTLMEFQYIFNDFGFLLKEFKRQKDYLLYTHESEVLEDILTFFGATQSSLSIMDIKIYKQIRNNVNRIINCETANIVKTVNASSKQIANIKYIVDNKGWEFIDDGLIEIALLRFNSPEMTLSEMDKCLSHPIGRSALNNRLKKLSKIADTIKEETEI